MKPTFLIVLTGSLVLNAALAYAALTGRSRLAESSAANAERPAPGAGLSASAATGPAPVDPATWSKLETADLPALVERLRGAGFPVDVIRAMLRGMIGEQFAARRRALDPEASRRAFWRDQAPDPRLQLARSQLFYEEQQVLRALLGADARPNDPLAVASFRSRLGNLPPEKMDAAQLILEEFGRKRMEFYATKGSVSSADLAPIEREQRAALAGILTTSQLEEYDFRNSNTGRNLRNELASFEASEAEFRAIYPLRLAFDEKYSTTSGLPSQVSMRQRADAQKQLVEQVKTLLGPERGADYERSIDYNFRQTSQLVARLELPPATAVALFNTQKEFEQRSQALYRTASTTSGFDRTQQLAALHQEALAKITPLLGTASGVAAYKQYGGSWLESLAPRPPPPK